MKVSAIIFILTALANIAVADNLRGGIIMEAVDETEEEAVATSMRRDLRELCSSSSSSSSDDNGIYNAGKVSQYNTGQITSILRKNDLVGFIKRWRSKNRLILTRSCWIRNSNTGGAYYCVDGRTFCVAVASMTRFYGEHTAGGPCGMLPLDDDTIDSLPENLQTAYYNTCDGDKCDG